MLWLKTEEEARKKNTRARPTRRRLGRAQSLSSLGPGGFRPLESQTWKKVLSFIICLYFLFLPFLRSQTAQLVALNRRKGITFVWSPENHCTSMGHPMPAVSAKSTPTFPPGNPFSVLHCHAPLGSRENGRKRKKYFWIFCCLFHWAQLCGSYVWSISNSNLIYFLYAHFLINPTWIMFDSGSLFQTSYSILTVSL